MVIIIAFLKYLNICMYVHMYVYICAYICVCMDDWNDTLGYMCAMYVPELL